MYIYICVRRWVFKSLSVGVYGISCLAKMSLNRQHLLLFPPNKLLNGQPSNSATNNDRCFCCCCSSLAAVRQQQVFKRFMGLFLFLFLFFSVEIFKKNFEDFFLFCFCLRIYFGYWVVISRGDIVFVLVYKFLFVLLFLLLVDWLGLAWLAESDSHERDRKKNKTKPNSNTVNDLKTI